MRRHSSGWGEGGRAKEESLHRTSEPQAHQYLKTQSTGMATKPQRKKIAWPPGLLERKNNNNNKVVSFPTLFLMFTLTWMKEEELKRVKTKDSNFVGRKK